MEPSYGRSHHYIGDDGVRYFAKQNIGKVIGAELDAAKFAPHIRNGDSVLDFACGGGFTLKTLCCQRRIGVEINPAAQEVARQNGLECYADLAEIPSAVADVAISNHALEHVPNPLQALRELHRTLRPEGTLVLVVPIDDWRTQRHFHRDDIDHHLYTWSPQLLGNCLVEAGFDPSRVAIRVLSHAWFPGYVRAYRLLPLVVFNALCSFHSILVKRRQLIAIARKQLVSG